MGSLLHSFAWLEFFLKLFFFQIGMQAVDTLNLCIYANIFLSPWLATELESLCSNPFLSWPTNIIALSQSSSLIQSDSFSVVRNLLHLKVFKIFQFPLKFRTFYVPEWILPHESCLKLGLLKFSLCLLVCLQLRNIFSIIYWIIVSLCVLFYPSETLIFFHVRASGLHFESFSFPSLYFCPVWDILSIWSSRLLVWVSAVTILST